MATVNENISLLITAFREHPSMMILSKDRNFKTIKSFTLGYLTGISGILDINLDTKMSIWFGKRVNEGGSLHWAEHVEAYYSDASEEELTKIFLQTVEDFFKENKDLFKQQE